MWGRDPQVMLKSLTNSEWEGHGQGRSEQGCVAAVYLLALGDKEWDTPGPVLLESAAVNEPDRGSGSAHEGAVVHAVCTRDKRRCTSSSTRQTFPSACFACA